MVMDALLVKYHGQEVGAVSFDENTGLGSFEYASSFLKTGIELAPLRMPLSNKIYSFPTLDYEAFKGLPGLVADSLPDDFGNAVLNSWIIAQGRSVKDISPLDRLKYTGKRGIGALTYSPATKLKKLNASTELQLASLVKVAQEMLDEREQFQVELAKAGQEDSEAMRALLSVGMSAGGARPKAVLAFDKDFTTVRSGQVAVPEGFTHYLLKFDGVNQYQSNKETFGDPLGYGAMEYVYYLMAQNCGIEMMPSRLLEEGKRRHFITQRFDRVGNHRIHTQTLNGIAHVSYKQAGVYSYEELFSVARELNLSATEAMQLFKRMVFNIVARNHDDHSKNFSFMLQQQAVGKHKWKLAPAYDVAYSYKPESKWVNSHWMLLNGKRDHFNREDFYQFEKISSLFTRRKINTIIDEVTAAVSQWQPLARQHDVPSALIKDIQLNLRLAL